jgi:hypothetical protein
MDPRAPLRAYTKHIGSKPALASAALGAGGAAAGYFGTDLAARAFLGLSLIGKDTPEKEDKWEELKRSGRLAKLKTIAAVLGGGAGVAYPMISSYFKGHSGKDNLKKYLNTNKFERDNPSAMQLEIDEAKKNPDPLNPSYIMQPSATYQSGRTFSKYASDTLDYFMEDNIPIHQARQLVRRDPFLNMGQKATVDGIIGGTNDGDSGLTSSGTIADTAIKAGFGALTGFAFGKTIGSVFAFDDAERKRLSRTGAVAGAILNSGILSRKL